MGHSADDKDDEETQTHFEQSVLERDAYRLSSPRAVLPRAVSPSAAIKWLKGFNDTGSCAARPRGGSVSPLETHADFLLALAQRPDSTLDELVLAIRKHRIAGSRSAVWRFFERHNITFEKRLRAAEQDRPDVARARRRWKRAQPPLDLARLVFIDETAANTKMTRLNGRGPPGERLIGRAARRTDIGKRSRSWALCGATAPERRL